MSRTVRRPIAVLLFGAVLRQALPWLAHLADVCDPADSATSAWDMRPIPGQRAIVPPAWSELEAGQ